jgi:signal recognition particle subunit SRP54
MASRILGMGDVVSLVEKAAEAVDLEDAKRMEEKMRKGQFTLDDFLDQLKQMKKLGSLESIVSMLPGGAQAIKEADLSKQEKEFRRMEGMISAMTLQERRNPQLLNARRRQRIAKCAASSFNARAMAALGHLCLCDRCHHAGLDATSRLAAAIR